MTFLAGQTLTAASLNGFLIGGTWTNFVAADMRNGWTQDSIAKPQYRREPSGRIGLRGRMNAGTTTNATVLAVLPVGYRPGVDLFMPVMVPVTNVSCGLEVLTTGEIRVWNIGSGTTICLDAITFLASDVL